MPAQPVSITTTPPATSCGCTDHAQDVVLDVRTIAHAIRHGVVFGAFDSIPAGGSFVLVAPHDPQPLLRQLRERDENLSVTYLVEGPEAWHLRLGR